MARSRFRELFEQSDQPRLIVAHRGDCSLAPENTLLAAAHGLESGASAWELDVHLTRDGVPVVIHDESLVRTTNVEALFAGDPRRWSGYLVVDFDLDEILSLDAGSWFLKSGEGQRTAHTLGTVQQIGPVTRQTILERAVRVPTLREALEWTKNRDWLVNVELKSFPHLDPRLTDATLAMISETQSGQHVLISSFDHREIRRVAVTAPGLAVAALCPTPIGRSASYARVVLGVDALHFVAEALGSASLAYQRHRHASSLAVEEIRSLRESDVAVLVYSVNDPVLARHLFEAGVTGVFSDKPSTLVGL